MKFIFLLIFYLFTFSISLFLFLLLYLSIRFYINKSKINKNWEDTNLFYTKNFNKNDFNKKIDSISSVEIIPIIDWFTENNNFSGEAGVSYLIKTDNKTILFDVGLNLHNEDPSPLLKNMSNLSISISDIDIIFISHNHLDHVGGLKFSKKRTFSLSSKQIPLKDIEVFTPIDMTYPDLNPITIKKPEIISKGVASIGVIQNFDFIGGLIEEQALTINVENKGIVLIIGCGHQTVEKIIARTKQIFDNNIYGIIGGLHFPISDSRIKIGKIPAQKFIGTCRPLWNPYKISDVKNSIEFLNNENIEFIALSGHDSCDKSIKLFEKYFKNKFQLIKVGKKIVI